MPIISADGQGSLNLRSFALFAVCFLGMLPASSNCSVSFSEEWNLPQIGEHIMKVERTILIPVEDESRPCVDGRHYGVSIMVVNTTYGKKTGIRLLQQYQEEVASDVCGKHFQRTSENNGKTWSEPTLIYEPVKTKEGVLRRGESALLLDENEDAILQFYNDHLYPESRYTGEVGKLTRIFLRISRDGGKTFTEPEQIIQKGFDKENWARDVMYGRNCACISFCAPTQTSEGKIILPTSRVPMDFNTDSPYLIPVEAGCFIGEWKENRLEWELSQMVRIDPNISSRGLDEPTIAELCDGSLLMIFRGSNMGITHQPGYRWHSISKDKGMSWSEVSPLTYHTGERFFSPATGSRFLLSGYGFEIDSQFRKWKALLDRQYPQRKSRWKSAEISFADSGGG
jgi:hypothetical protein